MLQEVTSNSLSTLPVSALMSPCFQIKAKDKEKALSLIK